jgi:hypothetical protein
MSLVNLPDSAVEKGTFPITVNFADKLGATITPNAGLKWGLTDSRGTVINSRSNVSLTPASSVNIVLHGADLDINDASYYGADRYVTITGTYDSSYGAGLELVVQIKFSIAKVITQ